MLKIHTISLASVLFLMFGPWVGSKIVSTHIRVDDMKYACGTVRMSMIQINNSLELSMNDLEIAVWALNKNKKAGIKCTTNTITRRGVK